MNGHLGQGNSSFAMKFKSLSCSNKLIEAISKFWWMGFSNYNEMNNVTCIVNGCKYSKETRKEEIYYCPNSFSMLLLSVLVDTMIFNIAIIQNFYKPLILIYIAYAGTQLRGWFESKNKVYSCDLGTFSSQWRKIISGESKNNDRIFNTEAVSLSYLVIKISIEIRK